LPSMEPSKLIIFDLDGVLIESREMHFDALNLALVIHGHPLISLQEHHTRFNGLPSRVKLEMLNIPEHEHEKILKTKQEETFRWLSSLPRDERLVSLFARLSGQGYKLAVVSNAIPETVYTALRRLGVFDYVHDIATPSAPSWAKPSPYMYWDVMIEARATARTTLIIEDSTIGCEAVRNSGAKLMQVDSPADVTYTNIIRRLAEEE